MTDRPAPLTPPGCDCRGLPFMPLEVQRLRDSDFTAISSGDEFKAGMLLWGASWGQLPAASLPNDDRVLARLAGCTPARFRGLRKAALHGFILCSDDRYYHPVIADRAIRAFARRWPKTTKSAGKGAESAGENPIESTESPLQGRGTVEGTDIDAGVGDAGFDEAWAAYPHVRGRSSRPKALAAWKRLSRPRRAALPAAIARYAREGREPKAQCGAPGMDRWLRDERFLDWLEAAPATAAPAGPLFPGPPELRAAAVAAKGEAWTRSWLDPCGWRNGAITTPNAFAADTLRRDLAALGVAVVDSPLLEGEGGARPEGVGG